MDYIQSLSQLKSNFKEALISLHFVLTSDHILTLLFAQTLPYPAALRFWTLIKVNLTSKVNIHFILALIFSLFPSTPRNILCEEPMQIQAMRVCMFRCARVGWYRDVWFCQLLKWEANSSYLPENRPIKAESGMSRGAGNQVNVPLISSVRLITVSHKLTCRCQLGLALHSFSRSKGSGVSLEVTQASDYVSVSSKTSGCHPEKWGAISSSNFSCLMKNKNSQFAGNGKFSLRDGSEWVLMLALCVCLWSVMDGVKHQRVLMLFFLKPCFPFFRALPKFAQIEKR